MPQYYAMCTKRLTMAHCVCLLGLIIAITLLGYASFAFTPDNSSIQYHLSKMTIASNSVTMVALLFRHGDRNPTETYENDPYKNYSWIGGYGALTKKGVEQMYTLGQMFNTRYKHLLPNSMYTKDKITVDSSAADRCLMSAASFLSGFWPPPNDWILPIKWQPIPIHYVQRQNDYLLAQKRKCDKYDTELSETYKNESLIESFDVNFDGFYEMLTNYTGQVMNNKLHAEFLYNTLEIESNNGLELPEWTIPIYPERLLSIAIRSLHLLTNTHFMKRIKGGSLISDVLHKVQSHIKNEDNVIAIYSAHDVTLVNFLRALGHDEKIKPEYGATIAIELQQAVGMAPTLQVLYFNNTHTTSPTIIPISTCTDHKLCTLTEFIHHVEVVTNILPSENWDEECKIS